MYDPTIVLIAAFMTAGSVAGLTYYAWTTKTDFTIMRGIFSMIFTALVLMLILMLFFQALALTLLFCFLVVISFGIYIIVDTQMIIGNKQYELNDEDYVIGALILYLDIVMLFVYLLRILG